jgi:hypothetical protein
LENDNSEGRFKHESGFFRKREGILQHVAFPTDEIAKPRKSHKSGNGRYPLDEFWLTINLGPNVHFFH